MRISPNVLKPVAIAAGALAIGTYALRGCEGNDGFGFGPDEHTKIEHAESVIERISFPASLNVVRGEGTGEASTQTRVQIKSDTPVIAQAAWLANKTVLSFTDKRAGAKRKGEIDLEIAGSAIDAEPYTIKTGENAGEPGIRVNIDIAGIRSSHSNMRTLEAHGSNDILPRAWHFLANDDGTAIRTSTAIDLADTSFESVCGKALLPNVYAGTQESIKGVYDIVANHVAQLEDGSEFASDLKQLAERPIDVKFYREVPYGDQHTRREEVDLVRNPSAITLPDPMGKPELEVSESTSIDTGADECRFTPGATAQQAENIMRANPGLAAQVPEL